VKVMGNRVYPEEVANQILKIGGVRDAAVVGVTSEDGRSVLLAFVAPLQRVELSAGAVRRALNTKLPAFMIPKEIVIVKQIPHGPTGKADGRRLVEEYTAAAGSRAVTKEAQVAS
jgi:long-chain acyl-CoA synthetase